MNETSNKKTTLYRMIRRIAGRSIRLFRYFGWKYYCPLCERRTRKFPPILPASGQEVVDTYHIISMGANPHYRCPWCHSSDKERLVWLFLNRKTSYLSTGETVSVLHIAPEKNTRKKFLSRKNIQYTFGDKFEGDWRYTPERYGGAMYLDVTNMSDFPENSFDLILCSHVLEHVPDDRKGMREIYRVLKKGGMAILQVPVSRDIKISIEDPSVNTSEGRDAAFGQKDHVRIYAEEDYMERLKKAGFIVRAVRADEILSAEDLNVGINEVERIYCAEKH